jgi:hypothetical protein
MIKKSFLRISGVTLVLGFLSLDLEIYPSNSRMSALIVRVPLVEEIVL